MTVAAKPKPKRQRKTTQPAPGQPTTYTDAIGRKICELLMSPLSLKGVCALGHPGIPDRRQVSRWLAQHDDFRKLYMEATYIRLDLIVDETPDIADDVEADAAEISKAKLRIDARWKMAERMAPRKYGLKQQIDATVTSHETWLEALR
jgi:hypothetical protein